MWKPEKHKIPQISRAHHTHTNYRCFAPSVFCRATNQIHTHRFFVSSFRFFFRLTLPLPAPHPHHDTAHTYSHVHDSHRNFRCFAPSVFGHFFVRLLPEHKDKTSPRPLLFPASRSIPQTPALHTPTITKMRSRPPVLSFLRPPAPFPRPPPCTHPQPQKLCRCLPYFFGLVFPANKDYTKPTVSTLQTRTITAHKQYTISRCPRPAHTHNYFTQTLHKITLPSLCTQSQSHNSYHCIQSFYCSWSSPPWTLTLHRSPLRAGFINFSICLQGTRPEHTPKPHFPFLVFIYYLSDEKELWH